MSPQEFVVSLRLWLGLALFPSVPSVVRCPYGAIIDEFGDHTLGCGSGPLRIKRHDVLCNMLFHSLMMDNAGVRREQTCSAQSNSRPGDIYHPDFLHGKPAYFDVSVRNSFHLAYTVKSAVQPGSAAEAGEIEKNSRHDSDVSSCGGLFYPFVIETFGIWSPQSLETLKIISRKCSIMSSISISKATSNLHELLSVRLWQYNTKLVVEN